MTSRRQDLGSWLEGTPGGTGPRGGLGLPESGPGSLASVPRRLAALAVDWVLSMCVSLLVAPPAATDLPPILATDSLVTLLVFTVSTAVLVGLVGGTIGHRALGLQVRRVAAPEVARPPGLLLAVVRSVLLALVVPAVVWDRDGRGMHDVAARTVIVRR